MSPRLDPSKLSLGDQIRLMRHKREMSINGLVAKSNGELSKATVSSVETGERLPALGTLEALARGLDCTFVVDSKRTHIRELNES